MTFDLSSDCQARCRIFVLRRPAQVIASCRFKVFYFCLSVSFIGAISAQSSTITPRYLYFGMMAMPCTDWLGCSGVRLSALITRMPDLSLFRAMPDSALH